MKYLVILLAVIMGLLIVTLSYADKWEDKSGMMSLRHINTDKLCRYRVASLAKEMTKAGVDFKVAYGKYKGEPHCWIVYKDKILDPSQVNDDPALYEMYDRI